MLDAKKKKNAIWRENSEQKLADHVALKTIVVLIRKREQ